MARPVRIVDYNPSWPEWYRQEKGALISALGDLLISVEHIGSTSVEGLSAKPIIDILAGVANLQDADLSIEHLEHIGYEYVPEYEKELPNRRYFRKGKASKHVHLHMVEIDSVFWRRQLAFRDYLRVHPETAREYDQLKRELAVQYGRDRSGYTEAKSEFIRSVETQALAGENVWRNTH